MQVTWNPLPQQLTEHGIREPRVALLFAERGDLRRNYSPQIVSLKFAILSFCLLTGDVDLHRAPSLLTLGRIRERRGALLFVQRKEICGELIRRRSQENFFLLSFCLILIFVFFLPFAFCRFRLCFVVSPFDFVIFLLSLIRERCGALLFALNEESVAKVIAVDSYQLRVFYLNTNLISTAQVRRKPRAVIFDREARIRERRGALLFVQRRSRNLPFSLVV